MLTSNHKKLLQAGFTIIRTEEVNGLKIKYKHGNQREWAVLEKGFLSKAALNRRVDELLKDNKTIID